MSDELRAKLNKMMTDLKASRAPHEDKMRQAKEWYWKYVVPKMKPREKQQ